MSLRHLFGDTLGSAFQDGPLRSIISTPIQSIERVLNMTTVPKMDMIDHGGHVVLLIELPGTRKEDVALTNDGRKIGLRVKRDPSFVLPVGATYLSHERSDTDYSRVIELPLGMKKGYVEAVLENGILRVVLEKDPSYDPTEQAIPVS